MPEIDEVWLDQHDWMLRSSDDGLSLSGKFKWPKIGKWIECPDWNTQTACGGGFHGNAKEASGYGFDYCRLELVETKGERVAIDGNKIKVQHARIVAIGRDIPDAAFAKCGWLVRRAIDGQAISPKDGEFWIIESGAVTVSGQSGGYCRFYGSHGTVSGQSGGECRFYDSSQGTVSGQSGGYCSFYSQGTVSGQSGGECSFYGSSQGTVSGQSGGYCYK